MNLIQDEKKAAHLIKDAAVKAAHLIKDAADAENEPKILKQMDGLKSHLS